MTPKTLTSISEVMADYDLFVLDLWGVVHNGIQAFPDALKFMAGAQKAGKSVVLLSNAPRRAPAVKTLLKEKIGVDPDLYNFLLTSGEDCFQHLVHKPDAFYQNLGQKFWFLGSEIKDQSMLAGHDFKRVEDPSVADFVLNCGPTGPQAKVADFEEHLSIWQAAKTPMICANPDRVVHVGDKFEICAGSIADAFDDLGGQTRWHGKPFASIYESLFSQLGFDGDRNRVLMVGDSLITDVAGARAASIHSALVTNGIYRDAISQKGLEQVCDEANEHPTYAVPALR